MFEKSDKAFASKYGFFLRLVIFIFGSNLLCTATLFLMRIISFYFFVGGLTAAFMGGIFLIYLALRGLNKNSNQINNQEDKNDKRIRRH